MVCQDGATFVLPRVRETAVVYLLYCTCCSVPVYSIKSIVHVHYCIMYSVPFVGVGKRGTQKNVHVLGFPE